MKNISKLLLFSTIALSMLWSCKKDEHKIYFEGGTAPGLSASSTAPMTLLIGNSANTAIRFNWTNPTYKFTTGISSQDVNYILEVDTVGANFTSPAKQEVAVARELGVSFTVKELNTILTKLNLQENMPHNVEFRVKSTLGGGSVPLASNSLKIVITPYLDVAVPVPPGDQLYITGSAVPSDWTNNPPATQKFTKLSKTLYEITMNFSPGNLYKFLSTPGQWQPQYGGKNPLGGDLGYNMGGGSDPDAIPTPSTSGTYKITVNFKTGKYTVVKQ